MDQDNSPLRDPPQSDGRTRVIAANLQWHDAELALKVARHCFERWRVAGPDTPLPATMQRSARTTRRLQCLNQASSFPYKFHDPGNQSAWAKQGFTGGSRRIHGIPVPATKVNSRYGTPSLATVGPR